MLVKNSSGLQGWMPPPPPGLSHGAHALATGTEQIEPAEHIMSDTFVLGHHADDPFTPVVLAGGFLAVSVWGKFKDFLGIGSKPAGTPERTSEPQTAVSKPVVPQPDVLRCQTPAQFHRIMLEYVLAGAHPEEIAEFVKDSADAFFSLNPTFEDVRRFYLNTKGDPAALLAIGHRAIEEGVVKSAREFSHLSLDLSIHVFKYKGPESNRAKAAFLERHVQTFLKLPDAGNNLHFILFDPACPFEVVHRVLQQAYGEGLVTEAGAFVRDVSLLTRFEGRTEEVYYFAIRHFLQFPKISAKQVREFGLAFPVAEAACLWAVAAHATLCTKSGLFALLEVCEDGPQRTPGSAWAHRFLMSFLNPHLIERFQLDVKDMKRIIGLFYGAKDVRPLLEKAVELGFANDPDSLLQLLSQQYESMLVLLSDLSDRKDGTFYDAREDFVQKNVETFFKLEPGPTFEQALVFLSYGRGFSDSAIVEKMKERGFLDAPLKFLTVLKTLNNYLNPQRASQIAREYAHLFRSFNPPPSVEESLEFANYLLVEEAIELYRELLTRNAVESSIHVLKLLRQLPYRGDRNVDLGETLRRVYEYAKGHELLTDEVVREFETRLRELA